MSWISKMFGLFLGEDEHNEKNTKNMSEEPLSGSSFEENEDMPQISDAKVVYEYPKGKFRFPVIPDQKAQQRENTREPQQRQRQRHSYNNPATRQRQSEVSINDTEKPAKKPFKPSVIPSPIYGYHEQKRIKPNHLPAKKQKEPRVTLFTEEMEREQRFFEQPIQKAPSHTVSQPAAELEKPVQKASVVREDSIFGGTSISHAYDAEREELRSVREESDTQAAEKSAGYVEEKETHAYVAEQEEPRTVREESDTQTAEKSAGYVEEKEAHAYVAEREEPRSVREESDTQAAEKSAGYVEEKETHAYVAEREEPRSVREESDTQAAEKSAGYVEEKETHAYDAEQEEPQTVLEESDVQLAEDRGASLDEKEVTDEEPVEKAGESGEEHSFFEENEASVHPPFSSEETEVLLRKAAAPENEAMSSPGIQMGEENGSPEQAEENEQAFPAERNRKDPEPLDPLERDNSESQAAVREKNESQELSDSKAGGNASGNLTAPKPKHRSSSVPFNVMMFAADKQKENAPNASRGYEFPSLALLDVPPAQKRDDQPWINEQRELLDVTLENFNVRANVVHVTQGPSVTRFEVHPEPGVKVNKITNLSDDIKLSLSAKDIRIEAPIPGKNTIGIEVPNLHSKMVYLREMIRSPEFRTNPSPLTAALGLDISGQPVVCDLKKMPHGLIAGATGSGKSVCLNTILVSLLFKADPTEVKLLLIDPKMVELAPYNEIPHLVSPVITDAKAATAALKWVVEEMERRYELFAHSGVRDIERFNEKVHEKKMGEKLPYLVVVIDELADLMMVAPNEVEESICRIAQKARACGIHLLIATQRPSVDVITGLIKANIPTRIAFSVSSNVDSRTIIDMAGAEKLLGKGDMLFLENGSGKPVRLQGNFVSDREIDRVVSHVRKQQKPSYLFEQEELVRQNPAGFDHDELFLEACEFAVEQNSASTSSLQRRFRIGYNRAARLIDMMEREGMISEAKGSKPREVLITRTDLEQLIESSSLFS
ncbi:DNA translocase FtsK [Bacillus glycinifermentans]|uniref:DNA translocase FtsK n=1 Tax=Bacillus glycinifermentans TaxID=1664069 RepID=UPI002DC03054|nr:DNA translocase FtsK [Bacillus glycinifermentans]MEC3605539.1 DNA translocase FtsK [Bacillus glycinifermentans]